MRRKSSLGGSFIDSFGSVDTKQWGNMMLNQKFTNIHSKHKWCKHIFQVVYVFLTKNTHIHSPFHRFGRFRNAGRGETPVQLATRMGHVEVVKVGHGWVRARWGCQRWWKILPKNTERSTTTRWWFHIFFCFHPYLGKILILTDIFQMGWNHQLEKGGV